MASKYHLNIIVNIINEEKVRIPIISELYFLLFLIIVSKCPTINRANKFIKTLINSPNCFESQINVGQECKFDCQAGFRLTQPLIQCIPDPNSISIGKWSQDIEKDLPTCNGNLFMTFSYNFNIQKLIKHI